MILAPHQRVSLALLRLFCRDPRRVPPSEAPPEYSLASAFATLRRVEPRWSTLVTGRAVVDFGCGHGHQSAALLQSGAGRVLCLEISKARLAEARALCDRLGVSSRADFSTEILPQMRGAYDLVLSQDAMEHYSDPAGALGAMRSLLKPGGRALITFGPPWFAPYGAHHRFFSPLPWAHLFFGERVMMAARAAFRADGCTRYEDVDGGLNRMSLKKFERLIQESGFRVVSRNYEAVKKLSLLARIPIARELFVSHATVWLEA